jgi:Fur family transcriptional regulator, ferric uptake regulator
MTPQPRPRTDPAEVLNAFIADRGLKSTRQRQIILEAFLAADDHLTVDELLARARSADPKVSPATVYRTMKLLSECGLARPQQFGVGQTVYEPLAGREHHGHLLCSECGLIVEFEDERIEDLLLSVAQSHGFTATDHRLELRGLCRRCQKSERKAR